MDFDWNEQLLDQMLDAADAPEKYRVWREN